MASGEKSSQIEEQGDTFFFYKPKVEADEVSSAEDVRLVVSSSYYPSYCKLQET
jgi:hypothetical protein